jgi:NAD kinase
LSADGRVEVPLHDGDQVRVQISPYLTRFARVQDPVYFYRNLTSRLTKNPSADKAK